ncbi:unnamed protein product [Cyclocybe aegerita]|uniref:Glycoside hydrolase subgroup catalytic core protein n=1 Tax=Cyclocybe aegerita TaxID=1973307 RepID=A0A8S0WYU9_CYCAE|nr:unnamed protein product [Cyclocybe aegerita]
MNGTNYRTWGDFPHVNINSVSSGHKKIGKLSLVPLPLMAQAERSAYHEDNLNHIPSPILETAGDCGLFQVYSLFKDSQCPPNRDRKLGKPVVHHARFGLLLPWTAAPTLVKMPRRDAFLFPEAMHAGRRMRAKCLLLGLLAPGVLTQTWCGKNYMAGSPIVPPGGQFPPVPTSETPLLAFRCAPAIRPYLAEDATSSDGVAVLIDTPITFSQIANAAPLKSSLSRSISVTVSVDGKRLTSGVVPLNTTKELPFSLSFLKPRVQAYTLTCTATLGRQTFSATGSLSYLPSLPPGIGSATKMDLRIGALLARPADGKGGPYAPVFPIGFYTNFGGYLAEDFSIPATLKAQGFTVVHPIPTFDNLTALEIVLDKMQEAGLYLMYDMRWTYMNATAVTEEVNRIKSRPNLLLWYTGDEPDGTSDPLDATLKSSNLIQSLDGGDGLGGAGYHPVSLVLNCQDYYFSEYTRGSDIVMQDAYPIGINATFSTVWGTICTKDYGDCGCDNCQGSLEDISTRMDEFSERLFVNGWERTKAVWTVPQGFGNSSYWNRYPTGQEFVVQSILGINHGTLGVVSWNDPTTPDIKASASKLALVLPQLNPFILNPRATFRHITVNRVDFGIWHVGTDALVLGTNINYSTAVIRMRDLGLPLSQVSVAQVLDTGASVDPARGHFIFQAVGSGAFVIKTN